MDYKIGIWNVRSMNNTKKQKEIKKFIYEERIHVFSIIETHVKATKLQKEKAWVCPSLSISTITSGTWMNLHYFSLPTVLTKSS
ncbi:hypothetical protein CTI12_AA562120 [Artemisia annua]|uniref:RNA-directed DNA polymerase, eukaryota, Reverse transcriptase zinc-binding domain protein n=1 Tax=Artemisia annua TaxID=35608 RepID=A0A2U1KUV6_ARTAN|nr:hypothetical protein CTI12_AA562120 [Artemisia annua]